MTIKDTDGRVQLAASVTPANNFVLDASGNDGTMRLARGNAGATTQDILTVDAAGRVGLPQLSNYTDDAAAAAGGVPIGSLYRTASAIKVRVA